MWSGSGEANPQNTGKEHDHIPSTATQKYPNPGL